jgi:putative colanic acid biosynthesis UDP-glucose lipid carrier transferase
MLTETMLHEKRSRSVHVSQSLLVPLYQAGDATSILSGIWLTCHLYAKPFGTNYLLAGSLGVLFFYFLAGLTDSYRIGRGAVFSRATNRMLLAWLCTSATLILVGYSLQITDRYSRQVILSWFGGVPILLILWRSSINHLLASIRSRGWNSRRVAIAGVNPTGLRLAAGITSNPQSGLLLDGFYSESDGPCDRFPNIPAPHLGKLSDLELAARDGRFDVVYIALPKSETSANVGLSNALRSCKATIFYVPDLLTFDLINSRFTDVGGVPAISLFDSPFYGVDGIAKRVEDIVVATAILAFIAVPMLAIAIAIKLTSRGPVIFTQLRYGLDGQAVRIYKFRTMYTCEEGDRAVQATRSDCRITPLGAILRRSSLDELPQFINVLQGRMSVVGPRPHPTALDDAHRDLIDGYSLRHRVRPGITGLAQVNGFRGETDKLEKMEGRIRNDLNYIRDWSVGLDLKIIVKTILTGFARTHAI